MFTSYSLLLLTLELHVTAQYTGRFVFHFNLVDDLLFEIGVMILMITKVNIECLKALICYVLLCSQPIFALLLYSSSLIGQWCLSIFRVSFHVIMSQILLY